MQALVGQEAQLSIGGFVFRVRAEGLPLLSPRSHGYVPFLGEPDDEAVGERIDVRVSPVAEWVPEGRLLFETGSRWSLREQGERREIAFFEMEADGSREPSFMLRFRPADREARLRYLPSLLAAQAHTGALRNPFHYPVDQLLTMYLLGARGLMIHAAGLDVGGQGIACAGVSGAGKTTFTRLAVEGRGWRPLTDERVIVRLDEPAGPVLHGTPWHGEGTWAENRALPLRALVFLEQGTVNAARRLAPAEGLPRLLRTVSLPWFDAAHVGQGLQACEQAVRGVPVVLLVFRREPEAADVLARFLADGAAGG